MTRRCSNCSNNGHNARTCPGRAGGVLLFGVRLTGPSKVGVVGPGMNKSASMGCLSISGALCSSPAAAGGVTGTGDGGYVSDEAVHASCSTNRHNDRKKGIPWTEEEHRMFLLGLQKLGKGDWRGISRNFVMSRTPTQVASHAQKYFIRQTNSSRRKRRSSLFDMVPETPMDHIPVLEEHLFPGSSHNETASTFLRPTFHVGHEDSEFPNTLQNSHLGQQESKFPERNLPSELKASVSYHNTTAPSFYPAYIPVQLALWPPNTAHAEGPVVTHEILKPTPVVVNEIIKTDEVVSMSKLSIGECNSGSMEPSSLSLKLLEATNTRQSAFHINRSVTRPELSKSNSNPIHAV